MTGRLKKGFKPNIVRQAYTIFKKINKNEKFSLLNLNLMQDMLGHENIFHALVRKNLVVLISLLVETMRE